MLPDHFFIVAPVVAQCRFGPVMELVYTTPLLPPRQYFGDVGWVGGFRARAENFGKPGGIADGDDVFLVRDIKTIRHFGIVIRIVADHDVLAFRFAGASAYGDAGQ